MKKPTKKPKPTAKVRGVKGCIFVMNLGKPETVAEKCKRFSKVLRAAAKDRYRSAPLDPLSSCQCLTVASMLDLLALSGLAQCASLESAKDQITPTPRRRK